MKMCVVNVDLKSTVTFIYAIYELAGKYVTNRRHVDQRNYAIC